MGWPAPGGNWAGLCDPEVYCPMRGIRLGYEGEGAHRCGGPGGYCRGWLGYPDIPPEPYCCTGKPWKENRGRNSYSTVLTYKFIEKHRSPVEGTGRNAAEFWTSCLFDSHFLLILCVKVRSHFNLPFNKTAPRSSPKKDVKSRYDVGKYKY